VRAIGGTPADAKKKQTASSSAKVCEQFRNALNHVHVKLVDNGFGFVEMSASKRHAASYSAAAACCITISIDLFRGIRG
jgi:hypothetical protein